MPKIAAARAMNDAMNSDGTLPTLEPKKAENTGMRNTQPSEKPAIAEKIHAKPIKQDIAIVQVLSFAIIGAEILPRSYFAAAFAWLAEEACVVI